jgi:hypothetical protein
MKETIMSNRINAAIAAGSLLAAPVALVATAPSASADVERHGSCGAGRYDFSVDREHSAFEVSADLDGVRPGSRWKVVLRHDGTVIASVVRRADREGDVDVERYRANTAGSDRFRMKLKRVSGTTTCRAQITLR